MIPYTVNKTNLHPGGVEYAILHCLNDHTELEMLPWVSANC